MSHIERKTKVITDLPEEFPLLILPWAYHQGRFQALQLVEELDMYDAGKTVYTVTARGPVLKKDGGVSKIGWGDRSWALGSFGRGNLADIPAEFAPFLIGATSLEVEGIAGLRAIHAGRLDS